MIMTQSVESAEVLPLDEKMLIEGAQKDLTAFSPLYERYAQQVYRYLLVRTGNPQDAQDLASATFMTAMQSLHKYRAEGAFGAWLLGIARHKVADLYRKRKPDVALETAVEETLPATEEAVDVQLDRQLAIEQVARKLKTLSPDRAEALSLRLFGGLEVAEIARMMNRDEAAVRMLVFRGLRDLKAQLQYLQESGT